MGKKSEKKAKPTFEADDVFANPSEAPASGDSWRLTTEENIGRLFVIRPLRSEEKDDSYKPGEKKEVIVTDIIEIDENDPASSVEHSEVWVWQGWLKGSLRGFIPKDGKKGSLVVARLGKSEKADRGNYPWIWVDGTADDKKLAAAWHAAQDPFGG